MASVMGMFNSLIYAAGELLPTIFIICFTVSMSELLAKTGVNEAMVTPIAKWMKGPVLAYWITGALMFIISSFLALPGCRIGRRRPPARRAESRPLPDGGSVRHEFIRPRFRFIRRLHHPGSA